MKIALFASEVVPFAKTGGLADVCGTLPQALKALGEDVVIIMPKYKGVEAPEFKLKKVASGVFCSAILGLPTYFIENDTFYNRDGLYGTKIGDYPDNLERFSYFCKRGLEVLREINFRPDVVHCHDWQTALIIVYLKTLFHKDSFFAGTKALFTLHNMGYQGIFPKEGFAKLGLDKNLFSPQGLEYFGKINLLKGGILFADAVNTVSVRYSEEIQTKEYGFGLEGVLRERKNVLFGILNGLDYSAWNPGTDQCISRKFSSKNPEDKYANKDALQKLCSLPVKRDVPVFGIVSRLASQKGFDILAEAMEEFCSLGAQMVILGTGDLKYHTILEVISKKYPAVVSLNERFDDPLAHKIYAGSDIFVMPSHYEPCGLGQMISLRYGTLPIVFKTGGLADTVNERVGFVFEKYSRGEFMKAVRRALTAYKDTAHWRQMMINAMQCDFSWEESAKKYVQLFRKMLAG